MRKVAVHARILALALMLSGTVSADDGLTASRQYALKPTQCGLDHGYVCQPQDEPEFIGIEADAEMVPGNYLAAWQIAFSDFLGIDLIDAEQKSLQHYKIGFGENPRQYVIHFQALLLPEITNGQHSGIRRGTIGLTTRYWINKDTMQIDRRLFYKG